MPRFVKPQQEWKWEIAIYLYLAGMGAGSFVIGTLINWFGVKLHVPFIPYSIPVLGYSLNFSKALILWGPIIVAIGAPFLILDLGIKWRFMYACLNPGTSWVARGFIILSVFIIFGLALLANSALPFEWLHAESALWWIVEIIAFVFAFGTAIYTGILLKATKSVPLWNTYLLPLLFLVSALSTGSMAIILSTLGTGLLPHDAAALKVLMGGEQVLVVIEGVVLYLFLSQRYRAADQGKDSVRLLLFGEMKLLFWGGIVVLGFVFPVVLEYLYSYFPGHPVLLFATGLFLLSGGFFLRMAVLASGVKEQLPMHKYIEMRYQLGAVKKSTSPEP